MDIMQQKKQLTLSLGSVDRSVCDHSAEILIASRLSESPTGDVRLLESILERSNLQKALQRVVSNEGAPGVDGMTVNKLRGYLGRHQDKLIKALLDGTYKPFPVLRKEIAKPDGGVRLLGIPTVLDRYIQQAIAQVLTCIWDHTFSDTSYGFRPNRSQADAIRKAKEFMDSGNCVCVDMDLSKFFDRVNHDRLMSRLATRVADKRVLKLIRAYLESGVMIDGLVTHYDEGTPQGGPLSPLLSNIVLDELDKELEKRNLHFARYADDVVIYVKSFRAGKRVKDSITRFITNRLRLVVNEQKSAVDFPRNRKWLGVRLVYHEGKAEAHPHAKSLARFKDRIREITCRRRGHKLSQIINELNLYTRGWWGYFRILDNIRLISSLEGWIRRRLRSLIWKRWKNSNTRVRELKKRGVAHYHAIRLGNSNKGPWPLSKTYSLTIALRNSYFSNLGLVFPWISHA